MYPLHWYPYILNALTLLPSPSPLWSHSHCYWFLELCIHFRFWVFQSHPFSLVGTFWLDLSLCLASHFLSLPTILPTALPHPLAPPCSLLTMSHLALLWELSLQFMSLAQRTLLL